MSRRVWSDLSKAEQEQAKALRASGESWASLSRRFDTSTYVLRVHVDDGYRARRREDKKRNLKGLSARKTFINTPTSGTTRITEAEVLARMDEIPDDTRGLTAFMFGDPLPGRSALDRRAS